MRLQRVAACAASVVVLVVGACRPAVAAEPGAQERAARKEVDALIRDAADGRATLGLIQRAIDLSIAFGAPAWNAGDHEACGRFYVRTAESLTAAFAGPGKASDPARQAVADLRAALDRVGGSADPDEKAWAVRYTFDKAAVAVSLQGERAAAMAALGRQCSDRGAFRDAVDAYADASAALHELRGMPLEQIPAACRVAPLALADARFARRQYAEAAAAVADGLTYVPDLATRGGDVVDRFPDPGLYKSLLADLRAAADRAPEDAAIQFLYGYHLFFSDQRDAGRERLERARKLDPKLAAADQLLNPPAAAADAPGAAERPRTPAPTAPPAQRELPKNGHL